MSALSVAQRAVLFAGLPSEVIARDRAINSPVELGPLLQWASTERLVGLLSSAVVHGELVIDGDDDASGQLAEALHRALRSSLAAEATAVVAVTELRRRGIEAVLFKGSANAHLDYPSPAQRNFFDVDLLVRREDFGPAIETMLDSGFERTSTPLGRRWERRFARAAELRSNDGVEVDLHAALATGYFGVILDHEALRSDVTDLPLGGVDCHAFGSTTRFLVSCYGVVLSRGPALRLHRDMAQQLFVTAADWRAAAALAGEGESVVAEALRRLSALTGAMHPAFEWAVEVADSPTASSALRLAERATTAGWSADARSAMLALGPVDRMRFIGPVLARRLWGKGRRSAS